MTPAGQTKTGAEGFFRARLNSQREKIQAVPAASAAAA